MTKEIKVGIALLIAIIIFAYFSFNVGVLRLPWKEPGYTIQVRFPSVAGLDEGAAVRIAGVRKGIVETIKVEEATAVVTLRLAHDVKLRQGASALVNSMGLMGEKYVELIPGDPEKPYIQEGATLQGTSPASVDQLVSVLSDIGRDIKAVTEVIRRIIGSKEGEESLSNIVDNLESISLSLKETFQHSQASFEESAKNIRAITADIRSLVEENREKTSRAVGNFEEISSNLRANLPRLIEKLDNLANNLSQFVSDAKIDVQPTIANIKNASEDLKKTLESVNNITSKLDKGEGTLGKLLTQDETHNKMIEVMDTLDETLAGAKRFLTRIERFQTDIGYNMDYLSNVEEYKNTVSLRLQPREDKFYLVELVDDPFGYVKEETTTVRVTNENGEVSEVTTHTRKVEDQFKFSLELAKRFYNFTFRGGLIESRGGVGIDFDLLRGKWVVAFDAYDFGDEIYDPHLRFFTTFKPHRNFLLRAGWDNMLNKEVDSFFFGLGISYTDEDLKYIMGSIPKP